MKDQHNENKRQNTHKSLETTNDPETNISMTLRKWWKNTAVCVLKVLIK